MSIIIMLLLLSVLILVHEAGHFLAARMFGIKVEKFGFGLPIGPTLYETKIGDVQVLVHAFLLGGYVAFPDDDENCDLPKDSKDRFINRPFYQRAIVVSAGVISNVICAYVLVLLTAVIWGQMPAGKYDIYINDINTEASTPARLADMKKGDRIVELNNTPITNTSSLISIIKMSKSYDSYIDENHATQILEELKKLNPAFTVNEVIAKDVIVKLPKETINEPPVYFNSLTEKGVQKYRRNQVKLEEKYIKLRDNLKNKKYYVSTEEYSMQDIAYALADNAHPLKFKVERNGKILELAPILPSQDGVIGVKLEAKEVLTPTKNLVTVITASSKYLYDNTYYMLNGLVQIFTGKIPLKDLHGIVAITKVGGDIIDNSGMFYGLLLTAIISMDLAIVNFLPIPALDGGHIMFLIIEKIRGKKLDDKIIEKISSACFYFLMILMVVIIVNDVVGLITKQF